MNKEFKAIQAQFLREQNLETLHNIYRNENAVKRGIGRIVFMNLLGLLFVVNLAAIGRLFFTIMMIICFLLIYLYRGKQNFVSLVGDIIEEKQ